MISMKLKSVKRDVLPNSVTTILRQAILKGDLKPNERLVQADIAEQLGVSRMPVREALKTLELEGLVSLEPHKGAIVNSLTLEDIDEIYELRTLLEPLTLKKSIPNLTVEAITSLEELHDEMLGTMDIESYVKLNNKFHNLSLSGSNSKRLHGLMARVSHGIAKDTPYVIPDQIEKSNIEHAGILNAIKAGDVEAACLEYAHHIKRTHEDLIPLLNLDEQ
ncbi:DNA-binding transcriptional regulator, GntR family [Lacicoccus alkaliphilus]|uniref:DNA-binding transcriptional regulator, GntR family n=2 Tax=Lacicoccus TaxID=3076172 RepID=A0A1M7DZ33_9BACL|nr:DNA-binding transcriptional regulator, GntR family [Salinicoccus alkaliphilus DSM 16010]